MDATRAPLSFERDPAAEHLQWAVAAGLVTALLVIGLLAVRELRFAPPSFVDADDAPSSTDVPREAVSVPLLILTAGHHVEVGEPRLDALAQLGSLPLLKRAEETGPLGTREVRSYQGLTLVFEPFERAGDSRVAGIYLQ
jgi:hypothetical protein